MSATLHMPFLLVDDDAVSLLAIKRTLQRLQVAGPLAVARDGLDALQWFAERARTTDGPLPPHIVTLDANMPRMNGLEFLQAIRHRPELCNLIVFLFAAPGSARPVSAPQPGRPAAYLCKDDLRGSLSRALDGIASARSASLLAP